MKFGVKTFDSIEFAELFKMRADFLEIMALDTEKSQKLHEYLKNYPLPVVIHAMHSKFGINNADKSIRLKNKGSIDLAIKLSDQLDSKKIILHPGFISNKNCSEEEAVDSIKELDERILLENLPRKNSFCSTPENTGDFLKKTGKELCLDFNHAFQAAKLRNLEINKFIEGFLKLKPAHFHIGGQKKTGKDHFAICESEVLITDFLKNTLMPKNAEITLEVSTDPDKTLKDLEIVRRLI